VVAQGLNASFPFLLFGDFQSPFLAIFVERYRGLSLYDLVGDVCLNPSVVLFPLIALQNL
jgi:hypothetical protein